MKINVVSGDVLIAEFNRELPNVPFAEGLSADSFKAGDDDPLFVVLPIAKVGTSLNQRHYTSADVASIVEQVNNNRPPAIMGHIPDKDRSTAHPIPAGFWVGAVQVGDMAYGKAYISKDDVREYIRALKMTGSKLGTSIYGTADQEWDKAIGAYRVKGVKIESIDFGSPDRIGHPALASVPSVTSEMVDVDEAKEVKMDKAQVIRELTADDAPIIPEVVRTAIQAQAPALKELVAVKELIGDGDVVSLVKELVKERDSLRVSVIKADIEAQVSQAVALPTIRPLVSELVLASNPTTTEAVKTAVAEIVGRDSIKALLATGVEAGAGGSLIVKENTEKTFNSSGMLKPESAEAIAGKEKGS